MKLAAEINGDTCVSNNVYLHEARDVRNPFSERRIIKIEISKWPRAGASINKKQSAWCVEIISRCSIINRRPVLATLLVQNYGAFVFNTVLALINPRSVTRSWTLVSAGTGQSLFPRLHPNYVCTVTTWCLLDDTKCHSSRINISATFPHEKSSRMKFRGRKKIGVRVCGGSYSNRYFYAVELFCVILVILY